MNSLTGAKVLKVERILFNAVEDIYFTRKMKFEKLSTQSSVQKKLINFDIYGFIGVMIVVHNTGVKTEKLRFFHSIFSERCWLLSPEV
jgi:hypothetical protein